MGSTRLTFSTGTCSESGRALMSGDPLIGSVEIFAGNFAPRGWVFCHGQLLSIAENNALFSILGTIYGGDGTNTFAVPDLRGRVWPRLPLLSRPEHLHRLHSLGLLGG